MKSGKILVEWDCDGHLNIKSSLSVTDGADKKQAVNVLLDAAKAINDAGSSLLSLPKPVRIVTGG